MKNFGSVVFIYAFLMLFVVFGSSNVNAIDRSTRESGRNGLKITRLVDNNGDAVGIAGRGFGANEPVLFVAEVSNTSATGTTKLSEWSVFSDPSGLVTTNLPASYFRGADRRFVVRSRGLTSGKSYQLTFSGFALAPSADLDQCANGPFASPVPCTGANWQNGNVGQSSGHYYEGDSIPYRMKFDDLATGPGNPHTVTIEWDTTQGGKHAIDYLTTYNRTENVGNDPCSGISPVCGSVSTFPIPLDSNVSGVGVTQIGGQVLTMWGGTITGVSAYSLSGSYAGNSSTAITITFTATQANPVLAWSGHIAKRQDWAALGGSASDIPGSPYHTRLIDLDGAGGNQDRSLSAAGVRLNSEIVIVKQASPESNQAFGFTTTGTGLNPFTLWDDGTDNDATPNRIVFSNLLSPSTSGSFTVTEDSGAGFYLLTALSCSQSLGGTSSFTTSVPSRLATINLQYGDTVTCTFNNAVTTAAGLYLGGRIANSNGFGLSRVLVTIYNASTGESRHTYSNTFGRYGFDDLRAGDFYVVSVSSKRYTFPSEAQSLVLNSAVENIDFIGN